MRLKELNGGDRGEDKSPVGSVRAENGLLSALDSLRAPLMWLGEKKQLH